MQQFKNLSVAMKTKETELKEKRKNVEELKTVSLLLNCSIIVIHKHLILYMICITTLGLR